MLFVLYFVLSNISILISALFWYFSGISFLIFVFLNFLHFNILDVTIINGLARLKKWTFSFNLYLIHSYL